MDQTFSPQPGSPAPKLVVQVPGSGRLEFTLDRPVLSLGRAPENDIVIEHASISRRHAQVMVQGGSVLIMDLGSSNGTFVGGERLPVGSPVPLPQEQEWYLGQVPASVQSPPPAAAEMHTMVSAGAEARPGLGLPPAGKSGPLAGNSKPAAGGRRRALLLAVIASLLLLLLLGITGAAMAIRMLRQGDARKLAVCEQPPMTVTLQGGVYYDARAAQQVVARGAPSSGGPGVISPELPAGSDGTEPILSTAFMEFPFPYDGGNENFGGTFDQFKLASQRNTGTGGRINSYFDHYLPLYPAPKDPGSPGGEEPAEAPIGKNILPFDGLLNPYFSYSGHPAIDFSTFVLRQPTTPVFAAADGVVFQVGTHGASGALFVRIRHTVVGVGDFLTIYWHLNPDEYFNAMLGTEGQFIKAGTRIGTMGNTGFSTGHHLHFEVRFDKDGNGVFSGSEVLDPYGYIPSSEYPDDPWFNRSNIRSGYLWKYPLGGSATVGPDGGGALPTLGGTGGAFGDDSTAPAAKPICAQPGTFPAGSQVLFSWAPDPAPSDQAAGTGNGCVLSVLDPQGKPLNQFDKPVTVVVPFKDSDLKNINPDTLKIYWLVPGSQTWEPLNTTLDFDKKVAIAETDRPGKCSLMGEPTTDILPPTTAIEIAGAQAQDGSLYQTVTVKLSSSDASGVQESFYSLDNGSTWKPYTGPFEVQPNGIPQPAEMDEEFVGGGPGTFLVLAYSVDKAGNVEDPPVSDYFSIDPSKDPSVPAIPTPTQTLTPTPTPTMTPTPTRTPTPTATATQVSCDLTFTLSKNANCRKGPGTVYDVYTSYLTGQTFTILGRSEGDVSANTWFQVQAPDGVGKCWLSAAVGSLSLTSGVGEVPEQGACLETVAAPPTPTPSPTPTPKPVDNTPPAAPVPISPIDTDLYCSTKVMLEWNAVSDPSGIDHYEWLLQKVDDGAVIETFTGSVGDTSVVVPVECSYYYYNWMVRAVDGAGNVGPYSPAETFYNTSIGY